MRRLVAWIAVPALSGIVVLASGCGIFSPRDPRPGGGSGVLCLTPNSPNDVVTNVLENYASLPGVTCYGSMLDTSFTFHPDAADSIDAGTDTVFANWTRDIEHAWPATSRPTPHSTSWRSIPITPRP